jgi:hypothetical protein
LPLLTHDFWIPEDFDSYAPYTSVSVKGIDSVLLDNGETVRFMTVQTTKGLEQGVNFGLYSNENFPVKAGETYRLSFLCAIHPNAVSPLDFTYILTAGNTTDPNQKLNFPANETNDIYAYTTGTFTLPVYKTEVIFKASYTDETSRILIGSKISKNLGLGSYGLIFVADIKIEHIEEYQREYERNLYSGMKRNWIPSDYYNYEDLDRIEEGIRVLNEKYMDFYNRDIGVVTSSEIRSEKTILFSDELNRIESNIEKLGRELGEPYDFLRPRTDWNYNSPFSFVDANRIANNTYNLYWYLTLNIDYVPYTGQYITGEEGVF